MIAIIRKSRPLMKRYPLSLLFPTDDADVDEDAGTDDDIELELVGTAVIDTTIKNKETIPCIVMLNLSHNLL